jgi:hypothetical protein
VEIRELEIVKNALNERFRRYHKLSRQLETELSDLKKTLLTNNQEVDKTNPNNKFDDKYYAVLVEKNKLREQCEVNEKKSAMLKNKEEKISAEYESFKLIFLKEIRNLKFDLDEAIRQRNLLRDTLMEFKNYFGSVTTTSTNK